MEMPQNEFIETYQEILGEIQNAFEHIDARQVERLVEEMERAEKIFVVGVGRVLLSLQAWVKRFNQLGKKMYFVGEITEPAITSSDLLIVGSGSGNSLFPVAIAKKAKQYGATVVHIGSNIAGDVSPFADFMVRIPVRTKLYLDDEVDSNQPMTTLFEQVLYLLGDTIAKMLLEKDRIELKSLWQYHANLE